MNRALFQYILATRAFLGILLSRSHIHIFTRSDILHIVISLTKRRIVIYSLTSLIMHNLFLRTGLRSFITITSSLALLAFLLPNTALGLAISDRVEVKVGILNVRATGSATGAIQGGQSYGSEGTIIGGPVTQGGFTWWDINYDYNPDGWSAEGTAEASFLEKVGAVTPPPPPATTPPPPASGSIAIGSRIEVSTTGYLNVSDTASLTGGVLGGQQQGSLGIVTDGPVSQGGHTWWKINYDYNPDGWSSGSYIILTTSEVNPPPPAPAPTPTPTPPPPPPAAAGTATITANATEAAPGAQITVTVAGGPGNISDWIAVALPSAAHTSYVNWKYLSGTQSQPSTGKTSATITFTMPQSAGTYEFRLFANNGYTLLARSEPITLTLGGGPDTDTQAPTTTISSPSSNALVSQTVTILATASDNIGVARVEFYVDGVLKSSDTSAPYSYAWDTTNGGAHACLGAHTHVLATKAYDAAGNVGLSADGTVNMNNPSYCTTITPTITASTATAAPGAQVTATIANGPGSATDWVALALSSSPNIGYISWQYLSGTQIQPTTGKTSATLTFTMPQSAGTYEFRFFANNAYTLLARSEQITVTSTGDTQAPTVPTNLTATVISSSQINLSWTASTDNTGVTKYKIFRDGVKIATEPTATTHQDTGLTANTTYSYTVSARDAAGNESARSAVVTAKTSTTNTAVDQKVKVLQAVRIRSNSSSSATSLGTATVGATGKTRCSLVSTTCPATADGFTWWYIDWDDSTLPTGWSAQGTSESDYLEFSVLPPPPPPPALFT